MNASAAPQVEHCRILLVAPALADGDMLAKLLAAALSGGDVASVILDSGTLDEATFQASAQKAIPVIQAKGAAAIILNDTRIAGRIGADGVHIEGNFATVAEAMEKHSPRLIVGAGNLRERHASLEIGELQPDYIFFGKIGADTKADAHPRNLALAEWWSELVEIPCIAQAGSSLESIKEAAKTGADFVALGRAVFESDDPAQTVADANRMLDEHAPRFAL
ncbi:thiamine phosphate synthase [Falsochrobactrum ovis]|uniref:Thiamine-phosphate diphosphorylase n=1 Tax=Falsochrobactrum ovis TaxID=1293442 RepID=A0A364JVT9_9HYPH|nr:thiamine phosphate synthase [Falsochrobactrum ovis]RAK29992.1 thiamine-phosphate diphosphorylase [Falsochrobactrum ovis]